MTLLKICGIRELEHAQVAAESGASLIGFVFVPVRREVKPEIAREILETVRQAHADSPAAVGLFVNESSETINRIVAEVGLDLVQLHGDESPELANELDVPAVKALRPDAGQTEAAVREAVEAYLSTFQAVQLDSHVPGQWGGTGVKGDWELAANLARDYPLVLAGGLSPENVVEAISSVAPAVADVSTGVETDGRKDVEKIRQFISNARSVAADTEVSPTARTFQDLIATIRRKQHIKPISTRPGIN